MQNPTARLETFCDGVFAIAITLLILEIKVPLHDAITSDHSLAQALIDQWPSWFAFLLSFGTILIAWANHHGALKQIDKSSSLFNFTNGFFLLTIVILPYPTSILAEYIDTDSARTAIMFYCFTIVLQNISWFLMFHSMLNPKDLSRNEATRNVIVKTRVQCIYAFFTYLAILGLAYWLPYVALGLMAVLWVVWIYVSITINQDESGMA
jgi:uncharacterized membrane protein